MKTIFSFLCYCLFLLGANTLLCQPIQAIVADKDTREPIADVFIFLDNSSIGATSLTDGSFELVLPDNRAFLLVFSHLNYEWLNLEVEENKPLPDTIFLRATTYRLDEATVSETYDPRLRRRRMRAFRKALVGKNITQKQVQLKNPEAILFSEKDGLLLAEVREPLVIENHLLGYQVQLFLETFELAENGQVFYQGKFFFDPMTGPPKQQASYQRQRLKRYQESSRKFFRDLVRRDIDPSIYELGYSQWNQQHSYMSDFKPIKLKNLMVREMEGQVFEVYPQGVFTIIDKEIVLKPDLSKPVPLPGEGVDPVALYRYKTQKFATSYFLARRGKIRVNQYGLILNPAEVEYYGYWGSLRVAAMFPSDYSSSDDSESSDEE